MIHPRIDALLDVVGGAGTNDRVFVDDTGDGTANTLTSVQLLERDPVDDHVVVTQAVAHGQLPGEVGLMATARSTVATWPARTRPGAGCLRRWRVGGGCRHPLICCHLLTHSS